MIYIIFTNKLFHYLKEKVIIMRKITLLVFLFAVVGNIKAAHYEYIPLVRDGVEWGYSQQLFGKSYYRNLIQADTIVNNIAYKKFYTFKSCSETADENLAFIRESGKQVYITFNKLLMPVESLCDREYLIYDFGVKEGETITRFDWITQKSVSSTISKIDTVEIANTLRQRFWTGDKVLWIEGIGVEDGDLLRPCCSTDVSGLDTQDKLVYVKGPDGNIEYETSDAVNDPCYSGIEEVDRDDDIVIIRNGRNLEIAVNDTKFRMIELVDISGRMVWCEYLDGRGKIVLSTADYPRGIYVIVLSSNEDRITRRVIF